MNLTELEAFDRRAPGAGKKERRFCCPTCGVDKPLDAQHRSLAVNMQTGLYTCHRCQDSGKLEEWFEDRPKLTRAQRSKAAALAAFTGRGSVPAIVTSSTPAPVEGGFDWRAAWSAAVEITTEGAGAEYLRGRGVPVELAQACGVKYSDQWYGRPGLLFPVHGQGGELVAISGRLIDGRNPKAQTAGQKSAGLFATPGALAGAVCAIVEGQFDALALAACGLPAVALLGTTAPTWLVRAVSSKFVLLASDADKAGDDCADRLAGEISTPRVLRLRPRGAKDWADRLVDLGVDRLAYALRGFAVDPLRSVEVDDIEGVAPLTSDDIRATVAIELAHAGRFDEARFVARMVDDLEVGVELERQFKSRQKEKHEAA